MKEGADYEKWSRRKETWAKKERIMRRRKKRSTWIERHNS